MGAKKYISIVFTILFVILFSTTVFAAEEKKIMDDSKNTDLTTVFPVDKEVLDKIQNNEMIDVIIVLKDNQNVLTTLTTKKLSKTEMDAAKSTIARIQDDAIVDLEKSGVKILTRYKLIPTVV